LTNEIGNAPVDQKMVGQASSLSKHGLEARATGDSSADLVHQNSLGYSLKADS
jgi:hypothetical protein